MSLEDVVLAVLVERGVLRVKQLSEEEIREVERIEREYSSSRSHWGRPVNVGVLECLGRRHVFAALTKPDFRWPEGPYALLKVGDRTVGVISEKGLQIDRRALVGARGERLVLLLPLRLPELEGFAESCVAASPSPPTHAHLLKLLGSSCGACGTLLIGFDDLKSSAEKSFKEALSRTNT